MRLALAVYARSPAAYDTLRDFKFFKLPARKTIETKLSKIRQGPGVKETLIELLSRQVGLATLLPAATVPLRDPRARRALHSRGLTRACSQVEKLSQTGETCNLADVGLYWDEVKFMSKMAFATRGSTFLGANSSAEEMCSLADLFVEYTAHAAQPVTASYACVFALRLLERPSIVSPILYVLTEETLRGPKVADSLREVLDFVHAKGYIVRLCCCDGASTNISALVSLFGSVSVSLLRSVSVSLPRSVSMCLGQSLGKPVCVCCGGKG